MASRAHSRSQRRDTRPSLSGSSAHESDGGNALAQERLALDVQGADDDVFGFLEAAFGSHKLTDVPVDTSGDDPRLSGAGTPGIAENGEVALAPDADPHVIAHEAAHVIQQRDGAPTVAEFPGGAEGHANAVADAVMSGESAESLLNLCAEASGTATGAQAYTTASGVKTSNGDDQLFKVEDDALSAKADADLPEDFERASGNGYRAVTFSGDYSNDCLGFAEQLAVGIDGREPSNRTQFRAHGDGTNRLFGHSDSNNKSIAAGTWDVGKAAAPGVGDAYGICRSGDEYGGDDTLKYHAATVIAIDGTDRITAEADASDQDRIEPVFDMYGTADDQTFQDAFAGNYGVDGANFGTGVLELRTDGVTYPMAMEDDD